MLKPAVIDLSHWNVIPGDYDEALRNLLLAREAGIQGLIHKATEGTGHVDEKLKVRARLAHDADMLFGTYHFLRPGDMLKQADHYYDSVKAVQRTAFDGQLWLWACDYEDPHIDLADVGEFMGRLAMLVAPHQQPILYSGSHLKDKIAAGQSASTLTQYRLWLAHYADQPVLPKGWSTYMLWQYSDKGKLPGIVAPTDVSAYDGDHDGLFTAWSGVQLPPRPVATDEPEVMHTKIVTITSTAPITVKVEG